MRHDQSFRFEAKSIASQFFSLLGQKQKVKHFDGIEELRHTRYLLTVASCSQAVILLLFIFSSFTLRYNFNSFIYYELFKLEELILTIICSLMVN